ncbi:MAG: CRTAC1 family protein, partial [Planctomycetota bacterium]
MRIALLFISGLAFASQDSKPAPESKPARIVMTEIDPAKAGIDFKHSMGGSGQKFVAETMGSGLALFDANGDGFLDVYFLQGAPLPGTPPFDSRSRFYLGNGDWNFKDSTGPSGLADAGYGMGAAVADIDNDGDLDVYTSAYGRGHVFTNKGSAVFVDTTETSGVLAEGFLSSAAFGDLDNDGYVDLYITNYLDYVEVKKNPYCGKHTPGGRAYCSPHAFSGAPDFLYKNVKGVKFEDISKEAGVARHGKVDGKGLGVVMSDFDLDGDLDIAVANDSCANFLYQNDGNFKLKEIAAFAGVAFAENGHERAGMGIDSADIDDDGKPDLFITNLDNEQNSLFRNLGNLVFEDFSGRSGLGPPAIPFVGFGCGLVDLDGDGDRDALIVNGHILDNAEIFSDLSTYRQRPMILENDGKGKFKVISSTLTFLKTPRVLRGLAFGDLDMDGDLDAMTTVSEGAPVLLCNESSPAANRIMIRLIGAKSNRAAIGAQVVWRAGGVERFSEIKAGWSYQSSSDPTLVLGLGDAKQLESLRITWPSGERFEASSLAAEYIYEI